MTRFARAKGSKSCNEKAPEDSTPWEVMKEQLLHSKKESEEANNRREAENLRIQNYENFLREQKIQKRKATWCDFPEPEGNQKKSIECSVPKKKKNKKQVSQNTSQITEDISKSDKKQKKKKNKKAKNTTDVPEIETSEELSQNVGIDEAADNFKNNGLDKKKKKAKKTTSQPIETNQESAINGSPTSKVNSSLQQKLVSKAKKNKKEFGNGKQVRRKEVNDSSFKLIINGKDVELVRFEGFPIMKRDAERIQELKTSMIKKGIPKSEVQRTIKLERRRAEKAVARLKRDVCYNCRKGGHNLSDCPDLKSKVPGSEVPDGVCFKCGSTEHRQFECKVQRDKEFRFATCFICKEAGHIARQCPDNPKGLYPNGGSCKLCGDVTHLRKDCPTVNEKKEETSIKLHTLESAENIEDIGKLEKATQGETTATTTKKPKKIKF